MLVMRGFMREKEHRVREGESQRRVKWEQRLQGYSLSQSLRDQLLLQNKITEPDVIIQFSSN